MGYRSEVAITLPNKNFMELLAKSKAENNYAYELIKDGSIYQTDKFTTMCFDWIKWYEDDEDIKFIEDFIRGVPHVFSRIGEEYDDIERIENDIKDYDIYDCVNIVRNLDIGGAGEEITINEKGDGADGFWQRAV